MSANLIMAIGAGGAFGALARHIFNQGITAMLGSNFPYGIMLCNILGGLLMGILTGLFSHAWAASPELKAFLVVGLLGGFTTFSSFSLDAVLLLERGQYGAGFIYIAGSVVLSLLALLAGLWMVRWWAI